MNKKLQAAFETEKSGDYKTALKMYSSLDAEKFEFDDKAKNHFLEDIKADSSSQDKMWDYWYLGQCDFLIKDYEKMVSDYQMAVEISEENQIGNLPFFIGHLMVALLLVNNEEAFLKNHDKIKAYEDSSYGLLKIVTAIYRKRKGYPDWQELYSKGIKEAEENKYIENIILGEFLWKL